MKKPTLTLHSLLCMLLCAAVAIAHALYIWQSTHEAEAISPCTLMIVIPFPLIAALLFYRGKGEGAWPILIVYTVLMAAMWFTLGPHLLDDEMIFLAILLLNLSALGTYTAYAVFRALNHYFSPYRTGKTHPK